MRRLHTRRAGDRSDSALDGVPPMLLEGDATDAPLDEGAALRPFAAAVPGLALPPADPAPDAPAAVRLLAHARELEQLGRRLEAIGLLRQALEEDPEQHEARIRLAELYETAGDTDLALEVLDLGLRTGRGLAALRVQRGALQSRLGRHVEAEEELRTAVRLDEGSATAHLHLGIALLRRGRHGDAMPCLLRAAALDPGSGEAAFHLAEAHYHTGDLAGAETALRRATELAPADPRAWKLLGRLLDRLGRTNEAMEMHRRAREAGVP